MGLSYNDTHFIAAMHNTSRDEIEYFDTEDLNGHHADFQQFQQQMFNALQHNAAERCRWFD